MKLERSDGGVAEYNRPKYSVNWPMVTAFFLGGKRSAAFLIALTIVGFGLNDLGTSR